MRIGRRAVLLGGTGLAASVAAGATTLRSRAVASPTRGVVCYGSASSPPPPAPPGPPLHPAALARFVDPLPIPSVLTAAGTREDPRGGGGKLPYYRVPMRETELRIHRDVPPTRGWGYAGAVPGPTLETRSGQGLLVEWANELPSSHFLPIDPTLHGAHPDAPQVRAVVHVHGAKAPPESDGYPEDSVVPGRSVTSVYPTAQEAATLWYHDHAMGLERLNQYAGLFGLFLVRDDAEDALQLPAGEHEIPLLLCDRILGADGQLRYPTSGSARSPWVSEVRGDAILVNGKLRPYLDVRPGAYRLRIVNAANARFFDLSLSGRTPMQQIGADQGLLAAPVTQTKVTLAPAERADVIVDFGDAAGQSVVLSDGASEVMEFRVARGAREKPLRLPPQLRSIPSAASLEAAARATRTLTLGEYVDPAMPERMLMLLDAKRWTDP